MRQLDEAMIQSLVARLNEKLREEAQIRCGEVERGLETAELGGLIVQKLGYGMDAAVQLLGQILDLRIGARIEVDAATAIVDRNWRENMHSRWNYCAGVDRSVPRQELPD